MTRPEFDSVLAIDTATRRLNLAVRFGGDRTVNSGETVERTHGQIIISKVDRLFQSAGLAVSDLQAVVVSLGPGSFTGLRIGLAAAKGIAVALKVPIAGVTLFEVAAHYLARDSGESHILIESRRAEFFLGIIREGVVMAEEIRIVAQSDLSTLIGTNPVFGIGFDPAAGLSAVLPCLTGGELLYDGCDVLEVGLQKLQRGEFSDLTALEPAYLQKSLAETRFERRPGTA